MDIMDEVCVGGRRPASMPRAAPRLPTKQAQQCRESPQPPRSTLGVGVGRGGVGSLALPARGLNALQHTLPSYREPPRRKYR